MTTLNPSDDCVDNIMTTRWLVRSLHNWISTNPHSPLPDPDTLYATAQKAISQAPQGTKMKDLLQIAKTIWNSSDVATEPQLIGNAFTHWGKVQDNAPSTKDDYRALATIFTDVQTAIPHASQQEKLYAIKALWTTHRGKTATPRP